MRVSCFAKLELIIFIAHISHDRHNRQWPNFFTFFQNPQIITAQIKNKYANQNTEHNNQNTKYTNQNSTGTPILVANLTLLSLFFTGLNNAVAYKNDKCDVCIL